MKGTLMKLFSYLIILISLSHNLMAQNVDSIHYSWQVFEFEEEIEGEVMRRCYVLSRPDNSKTNYTGKRDPYLAVTRYEHNYKEEINISVGFEFKTNSVANVLVDKKDFKFFTRDKSAWLDSAKKDKNFIEAMLGSNSIKVRSDSVFGSYAIDEYTLKGFARAYRRMKNICSN